MRHLSNEKATRAIEHLSTLDDRELIRYDRKLQTGIDNAIDMLKNPRFDPKTAQRSEIETYELGARKDLEHLQFEQRMVRVVWTRRHGAG